MKAHTYAGKTLGEWMDRLGNADSYVRLGAARALRYMGPDAVAAVPALVRALDDSDGFVRSGAAFALGKIGPGAADAVPAMVRVLRRSGYFDQGIIGPAIAGIGPAAVPALIDLTRDRDHQVRFEAVGDLGRIGTGMDEVARRLGELLTDGDASIRAEAAFALWKTAQSRDGIPVLARCLGDPNEFARMSAADHLGEIGPDAAEAVPALIRAMDDSNQAVRNRSATALGKIGPAAKDAVPILVRSVDRGSHEVSRQSVTEAIARIGTPAVPELIRGLEDQAEFTRGVAAESLGRIGPSANEAVPVLAEMAQKEPQIVMRLVAADALWRTVRDERAIPILLEALRVGTAQNQLFAMKILAEVGPAGKDAVPFLISVLNRADPFQSRDTSAEKRRPEDAAKTLGRIGPEARAAVPALEAALEDPDGNIRTSTGLALWRIAHSELALKALSGELHDPDQNTRFDAAMALGEIGPAAQSAVPALIEALKNDPSIRSITAKALAQIGPAAKAAVPALVEVFENDTSLADDDVPKALKAIDSKAAALEGIR